MIQALSSHGVTLRTPQKIPLFSAFFTQPTTRSSSSAPPPHVEVPYHGHPHWPPLPPPPYYYLPYSYPSVAPPPPPIAIAASTSAPKQNLNRTATASSQSTQPDELKYPLLSDFFSTLFARHPERPALATFSDLFRQHNIFNLQEILHFDETRL